MCTQSHRRGYFLLSLTGIKLCVLAVVCVSVKNNFGQTSGYSFFFQKEKIKNVSSVRHQVDQSWQMELEPSPNKQLLISQGFYIMQFSSGQASVGIGLI